MLRIYTVFVALVGGLVGACAPAPAQTPTSEIDLSETRDEPREPAVPRQQQCGKDDTGCARKAPTAGEETAASLDPNQRYQVATDASDPHRGPAEAPIQMIVFSDFQCPFCRHLELVLAQLLIRHPSDLQLIWKDMPLEMHQFALPAALLAREAFAHGGDREFWPVHDELYVKQPEFSEATLAALAQQFGLHWPPLMQQRSHVDATYQQGIALNIRATPTVFVNGRPVIGAKPIDEFERLITAELAASSAPPPAESSTASTP
jgi:protein-disulfide isomerase